MAIAPITLGDLQARAKTNAAIEKANLVDSKASLTSLTAGLTAESSARAIGLAIEGSARKQADADERAARLQAINAEAAARRVDLLSLPLAPAIQHRPGDAPLEFGRSLANGEALAVTEIPSDLIRVDENGKVVRTTGDDLVAPRHLYPLELGRRYLASFVVQRRVNSPDPDNDAIRCAVAWYGQNKDRLPGPAQTLVQDLLGLTTGAGRQVVRTVVARAAGADVGIVAPADARYARPFVQTFGSLVENDIEIIGWTDITDVVAFAPDVSAIDDRLSAIESLDLGDRIEDAESQISAPNEYRVSTIGALAAADVPVSVNSVLALNGAAIGDGLQRRFRATSALPAASDKVQSADGRWWEPTFFKAPTLDPLDDRGYVTAKRAFDGIHEQTIYALRPKKLKFVLMADGQPATEDQRALVNNLIAHVALRQPDANAVIYAGDIAHRANNPEPTWPGSTAWWSEEPILYDKIMADLDALPVSRAMMFTIAGNHDINYGTGASKNEMTFENYEKAFGPLFYHVVWGGILIVFMSTMARATAGNIPDYVHARWRELVREHQDKIVVTVSHQPLQNTTAGSQTTGGSQVGSSRFTEAMAEPDGRVDLWLSGHTGKDLNNPAVVSHGDFFNTHCIALDMNSGVNEFGEAGAGLGMSYTVMEFEHGSDTATFKRWNVDTDTISKNWTKTFGKKAILEARPSFDGRTQKDARQFVPMLPTVQAVPVARQSDDGGLTWVAPYKVNWIDHKILHDQFNNNVQIGSGPGVLGYVPGSAISGGTSVVAPELNHAYGAGGGWSVTKLADTDDNYAAAFDIWASTSGQGEDSLVKVISFGASEAFLRVPNYSIRGQSATAGISNAILTLAQSTGGTSAVIAPRGPDGSTGYSSADACLYLSYTAAGRALNAGGTLNASGADYAEYREVKPHLYGVAPKGALLGIAADGLLTDRWAEIKGRIYVKSTAPNLVGNDGWSREESLVARYGIAPVGELPIYNEPPVAVPPAPEFERQIDSVSDLTSQEHAEVDAWASKVEAIKAGHPAIVAQAKAAHEAAIVAYRDRAAALAASLETERARWDRMAIAGITPINVPATLSDIGAYLVPCAAPDGSIAARLVGPGEIEWRDYVSAIGTVAAITDDGRAIVEVKVN